MEKQIKTIGVLTSGGDAPGMNAAVRAVVRTGLHKGYRMIGIQRGYNGLLNGECFEMNLRSVSNIISAGGTILYTARCLEFKTKEGQDRGAAKCRELGIDALVVIGGFLQCKSCISFPSSVSFCFLEFTYMICASS